MEGKIWSKFHPLFGSDLKVGFEMTFSKGAAALDGLNPLYEKSGLIHKPLNETVTRVYEPAVEILGSCKDSDGAQVLFEPALPDGVLFRRLILTRKIDHHSGKPRRWMVAARYGEATHFGLGSWNSKDQRYLSLAYPGLNPEFVPVYFKIQMEGGDFVYLEVWAWGSDKIVVQGRRVRENEVPESLILARHGLKT